MTPSTAQVLSHQEKPSACKAMHTASTEGTRLCGSEVGRALLNQNFILFTGGMFLPVAKVRNKGGISGILGLGLVLVWDKNAL